MANCRSNIVLSSEKFESCGDFGVDLRSVGSTDLSGLQSLKEFKDTMVSEFTDAKCWKTQPSYPTRKLVYDRYMNSTDFCDTLSSQFDYCEMIQFSELVGTYWVDLIEQVIPATTIWGSTYVYGNTLWDQQKFQYKKYSLYTCELPEFGGDVVSPTTGWTGDVQVQLETLPNDEYYDTVSGSTTGQTFTSISYQRVVNGTLVVIPKDFGCLGAGIVQMNCGSEFVGQIIDYSSGG